MPAQGLRSQGWNRDDHSEGHKYASVCVCLCEGVCTQRTHKNLIKRELLGGRIKKHLHVESICDFINLHLHLRRVALSSVQQPVAHNRWSVALAALSFSRPGTWLRRAGKDLLWRLFLFIYCEFLKFLFAWRNFCTHFNLPWMSLNDPP